MTTNSYLVKAAWSKSQSRDIGGEVRMYVAAGTVDIDVPRQIFVA
jgi:hypothetical protein